jgi:exodeoxyribonuclease V alpha subunit
VMTRELIYTGLTRARSRVEVWFKPELFELGIARRTQRASGLQDALRKN